MGGHPLCRRQGAAQRSQAQQGPGTCHGALSAGHRWFARVVAECEHAAEGSAGPHQLRQLASKAYTARTVEQLRAGIEQIADELLDGIDSGAVLGAVDLMEHFVAPLPIRVIGELLGVAAAERDNFKAGVEPVLTDTNAPLR